MRGGWDGRSCYGLSPRRSHLGCRLSSAELFQLRQTPKPWTNQWKDCREANKCWNSGQHMQVIKRIADLDRYLISATERNGSCMLIALILCSYILKPISNHALNDQSNVRLVMLGTWFVVFFTRNQCMFLEVSETIRATTKSAINASHCVFSLRRTTSIALADSGTQVITFRLPASRSAFFFSILSNWARCECAQPLAPHRPQVNTAICFQSLFSRQSILSLEVTRMRARCYTVYHKTYTTKIYVSQIP